MGQYYKYLVIEKDNTIHTQRSWNYDSGSKLMEHSYIGNSFVNSAFNLIINNPCKVAWVGDYSKDGACVLNNKAKGFNLYYIMCWGYSDVEKNIEIDPNAEDEILPKTALIKFNIENCKYFLINHTKKIYVDIENYVNNCKWHEEGDRYNGEHYSYDKCINPLPLLTACGNNQGGGDFYDSCIGFNDVGTWALDIIELTEDKPADYTEVEYRFVER